MPSDEPKMVSSFAITNAPWSAPLIATSNASFLSPSCASSIALWSELYSSPSSATLRPLWNFPSSAASGSSDELLDEFFVHFCTLMGAPTSSIQVQSGVDPAKFYRKNWI